MGRGAKSSGSPEQNELYTRAVAECSRMLHRLPAGTTSLSSLGIPVIAIFSSWIQLGEQPGGSELIGMLLIGIALALLSYLSIRRHEEPEPMTGQE